MFSKKVFFKAFPNEEEMLKLWKDYEKVKTDESLKKVADYFTRQHVRSIKLLNYEGVPDKLFDHIKDLEILSRYSKVDLDKLCKEERISESVSKAIYFQLDPTLSIAKILQEGCSTSIIIQVKKSKNISIPFLTKHLVGDIPKKYVLLALVAAFTTSADVTVEQIQPFKVLDIQKYDLEELMLFWYAWVVLCVRALITKQETLLVFDKLFIAISKCLNANQESFIITKNCTKLPKITFFNEWTNKAIGIASHLLGKLEYCERLATKLVDLLINADSDAQKFTWMVINELCFYRILQPTFLIQNQSDLLLVKLSESISIRDKCVDFLIKGNLSIDSPPSPSLQNQDDLRTFNVLFVSKYLKTYVLTATDASILFSSLLLRQEPLIHLRPQFQQCLLAQEWDKYICNLLTRNKFVNSCLDNLYWFLLDNSLLVSEFVKDPVLYSSILLHVNESQFHPLIREIFVNLSKFTTDISEYQSFFEATHKSCTSNLITYIECFTDVLSSLDDIRAINTFQHIIYQYKFTELLFPSANKPSTFNKHVLLSLLYRLLNHNKEETVVSLQQFDLIQLLSPVLTNDDASLLIDMIYCEYSTNSTYGLQFMDHLIKTTLQQQSLYQKCAIYFKDFKHVMSHVNQNDLVILFIKNFPNCHQDALLHWQSIVLSFCSFYLTPITVKHLYKVFPKSDSMKLVWLSTMTQLSENLPTNALYFTNGSKCEFPSVPLLQSVPFSFYINYSGPINISFQYQSVSITFSIQSDLKITVSHLANQLYNKSFALTSSNTTMNTVNTVIASLTTAKNTLKINILFPIQTSLEIGMGSLVLPHLTPVVSGNQALLLKCIFFSNASPIELIQFNTSHLFPNQHKTQIIGAYTTQQLENKELVNVLSMEQRTVSVKTLYKYIDHTNHLFNLHEHCTSIELMSQYIKYLAAFKHKELQFILNKYPQLIDPSVVAIMAPSCTNLLDWTSCSEQVMEEYKINMALMPLPLLLKALETFPQSKATPFAVHLAIQKTIEGIKQDTHALSILTNWCLSLSESTVKQLLNQLTLSVLKPIFPFIANVIQQLAYKYPSTIVEFVYDHLDPLYLMNCVDNEDIPLYKHLAFQEPLKVLFIIKDMNTVGIHYISLCCYHTHPTIASYMQPHLKRMQSYTFEQINYFITLPEWGLLFNLAYPSFSIEIDAIMLKWIPMIPIPNKQMFINAFINTSEPSLIYTVVGIMLLNATTDLTNLLKWSVSISFHYPQLLTEHPIESLVMYMTHFGSQSTMNSKQTSLQPSQSNLFQSQGQWTTHLEKALQQAHTWPSTPEVLYCLFRLVLLGMNHASYKVQLQSRGLFMSHFNRIYMDKPLLHSIMAFMTADTLNHDLEAEIMISFITSHYLQSRDHPQSTMELVKFILKKYPNCTLENELDLLIPQIDQRLKEMNKHLVHYQQLYSHGFTCTKEDLVGSLESIEIEKAALVSHSISKVTLIPTSSIVYTEGYLPASTQTSLDFYSNWTLGSTFYKMTDFELNSTYMVIKNNKYMIKDLITTYSHPNCLYLYFDGLVIELELDLAIQTDILHCFISCGMQMVPQKQININTDATDVYKDGKMMTREYILMKNLEFGCDFIKPSSLDHKDVLRWGGYTGEFTSRKQYLNEYWTHLTPTQLNLPSSTPIVVNSKEEQLLLMMEDLLVDYTVKVGSYYGNKYGQLFQQKKGKSELLPIHTHLSPVKGIHKQCSWSNSITNGVWSKDINAIQVLETIDFILVLTKDKLLILDQNNHIKSEMNSTINYIYEADELHCIGKIKDGFVVLKLDPLNIIKEYTCEGVSSIQVNDGVICTFSNGLIHYK